MPRRTNERAVWLVQTRLRLTPVVAALLALAAVSSHPSIAGVIQVADIYSGSSSSNPMGLTSFQGKLYFSAETASAGRELRSWNGESIGLVRDYVAGSGSGFDESFAEMKVFKNRLYFAAQTSSSGNHLNRELRAYDGTNFYVADINSGTGSSDPSGFSMHQNLLYFAADNGAGSELWSTDGSTASLAAEFNVKNNRGSSPNHITSFNSKIYLQADGQLTNSNSSKTGTELYSFDGSSVALVSDINSGSSGSSPQSLTVVANHLYFTANDGSGSSLYSLSNTGTLQEIGGVANPSQLVEYKGKLYMSADGSSGQELYQYDGTTLSLVGDINTSGDSNPTTPYRYNNELFFSAIGDDGRELYSYDGSTISQQSNVNTSGDSNPGELFKHSGRLYFQATDGATGSELYQLTPDELIVDDEVHVWHDLSVDATQVLSTGALSIESPASLTSPTVTVQQGGTLAGSGTIVGTVSNSGSLAPGQFPGPDLATLTVDGNTTFGSSSTYLFEVSDFAGDTGDADENLRGWDLLESSSITIDSGSVLDVTSLAINDGALESGLVDNFDNSQEYQLLIARATSGNITGTFTLDTTNFQNDIGSSSQFYLSNTGQELYLHFGTVNVPEPASLLGVSMALLALACHHWNCRRSRERPVGSGDPSAKTSIANGLSIPCCDTHPG